MRRALLFCVALASCGSVTTADVDGGGRLEAGNTGAAGAAPATDAALEHGNTGAAGADALEAAAGACGDVAPWMLGKGYAAGDRAEGGGSVYQCRPFPNSGWCGLDTAYSPGVGFRWQDAWTLVGPCP
jgi:hypothetical protein